MRSCRALPLGGLIVVAVLCSLPAAAFADASGSTESAPPRVSIAIIATAGDEEDAGAVEARVVSWFHEQRTPTETSRPSVVDAGGIFSPTGEPGVRIWVLLKLPALVRVFFAVEEPGKRAPRYLVRDVALDGGLDELGLEQVAQVVDLSAMALWAGNLESSRQEVERGLGVGLPSARDRAITPEPGARRPPMSPGESREAPFPPLVNWRASVAVGLEYAARLSGPEGLAHGPGANVGLLFRRRPWEVGARLHALLLLPREVSESGVTLELHGASVGLGAAALHEVSERVWASAELGTGFDLIEYDVISLRDATLRPRATRPEVRPLGYASLGLRVSLGAVNLGGALFVAAQFFRTHYDIADTGQRSELFRPWQVQPGLAASVTW